MSSDHSNNNDMNDIDKRVELLYMTSFPKADGDVDDEYFFPLARGPSPLVVELFHYYGPLFAEMVGFDTSDEAIQRFYAFLVPKFGKNVLEVRRVVALALIYVSQQQGAKGGGLTLTALADARNRVAIALQSNKEGGIV